jgi:hypothetical protein
MTILFSAVNIALVIISALLYSQGEISRASYFLLAILVNTLLMTNRYLYKIVNTLLMTNRYLYKIANKPITTVFYKPPEDVCV